MRFTPTQTFYTDKCFFIELKLFQIKQTLVLCEWFVDDKLSIHFWEDKQETKGFKRQLDTKRGIQIKQHPYVKCSVLTRTCLGSQRYLSH